MPPSPLLLELPVTPDLKPGYAEAPRPRIARPDGPVSPALALLTHAEQRNAQNRHENLGFLSWERGFLPRADPRRRLPHDYRAWDQIAAELPNLYANLTVRKRVEELPLLDASKPHLADEDVLRSAGILAILAHAYWYCQPTTVNKLPEVIGKPWAQLRARLGRRQETITYIDLIVYNWQRKDPNGPLVVENLSLLLPTIGNQEEQVFYLTQLEILARCSQVLRTMLIAQGAVIGGDTRRLEAALFALAEQLEGIVRTSLPKISPHAHSHTFVDAVTWAKTVAPFAVPFHQGVLGPSGTSSPIFNALDIFLGRKQYSSFLGKEIQQLRTVYPPFWRALMLALSSVNTAAFVAASKSTTLRDAYRLASDAYAGDGGFLGRHRMKVYGFLELAFKVGRAVTIGGFGGAFKDRTWDQVDTELTRSRVERPATAPSTLPRATVTRVAGTGSAASTLHRLKLTLPPGARAHFQPGDHVQIWPSHRDELVAKTLRAARATGEEPVVLTEEWQRAFVERGLDREVAKLGDLLPHATLKQLTPRAAAMLLAIHPNSWLRLTVEAGRLRDVEVWRALDRLREDGFPCERILESPENAGLLFDPEPPRTYSIASEPPRSPLGASSIELAVRRHAEDNHEGTASSFLCRLVDSPGSVPFAIQKSSAFGPLPAPSVPLVAFAAGSGVAPMLSLLTQRFREGAKLNWLVLSLSRVEDFQFTADWHNAVSNGLLRLDVVFTRQGAQLRHDPLEGFSFAAGKHRHIQDLVKEPQLSADLFTWLRGTANLAPANVYVCGGASFSGTARQCLETVVTLHTEGTPVERKQQVQRMLLDLVGQRRLNIEAHTDAAPATEDALFTPADVASHNSEADGYWIVVNDVVYDLTEFRDLHPGGARIIDAYAGMDATHGFSRAHNGRPDIAAQLATYRKGRLYSPVFESRAALVDSPAGPRPVDHAGVYRAYVSALNLCVEMQNALRTDLSLATQVVHPGIASDTPSRYVWARQAETHHRFLATYVAVLSGETLPNLEAVSRALFEASEPSELVMDPIASSAPPAANDTDFAPQNLEAARRLVAETAHSSHLTDRIFAPVIVRLAELDLALLVDLKELLRCAVNALAYREQSATPGGPHPVAALNAKARTRLTQYERAVADLG